MNTDYIFSPENPYDYPAFMDLSTDWVTWLGFHGMMKQAMDNHNPYQDKKGRLSSHWWIVKILETLPEGARVLDVGTASGMLVRACSGRYFIFRGIEPVTAWVEPAHRLYAEIYPGTLEQTPDNFLSGHAAVVCGDVLEHLVNPQEQLARLVALQPIGCLFVISVPNIANIWVRLNLLLGRFDYSDRGILDATHLHFYTRKTFLKLLQDAGLLLQELQATPIPLDLVSPFFVNHPIGKVIFTVLTDLTRIWPTMLGYQWVAKAIK